MIKKILGIALLLAAVSSHRVACQYTSLPAATSSLTTEPAVCQYQPSIPESQEPCLPEPTVPEIPEGEGCVPSEPVIPEVPHIASQAQTIRSWIENGEHHELLSYLDVEGCAHTLHRWVDVSGCKHAVDAWIDASSNAHQVSIWEDGDGCHHEVHQCTSPAGVVESTHYRIDQHGVTSVVEHTQSVPQTCG